MTYDETGNFPKDYIIHIAEEVPCENGRTLYRAQGFKTLVFDDEGLRKLKPFNPKAIREAAYTKGWEDGYAGAREMFERSFKGESGNVFNALDETVEKFDEYLSTIVEKGEE